MSIRTRPLPEISVARFQEMAEVIDFSPPYQREGGVWRPETRQTLIDSLINGLDIPKLYFEIQTTRRRSSTGQTLLYAVLDGKQRLEAILDFLSGGFPLADDFRFFDDESIKAQKSTFGELQEKFPALAQRLRDYELPIVTVLSDDGDLVEEMFQRLNAASDLNAAERRNAIAGATRDAVNELATHPLLERRSPIKNARYKYRELAAKFLAIENQIDTPPNHRVQDTKAATLRQLFLATGRANPTMSASTMAGYQRRAGEVLDSMNLVFEDDDRLLASIGTVVVYYIVFRGADFAIDRTRLERFEFLRRRAGRLTEIDADYGRGANARLREYNAFVQSTNDGSALRRRAAVLSTFLRQPDESAGLNALDVLGDGEPPSDDDDG